MQSYPREGDESHECEVRVPEAEQAGPLSLSTLQLEWEAFHHAKRVLASLDLQRATSFLYISLPRLTRIVLHSGRLAEGRRS